MCVCVCVCVYVCVRVMDAVRRTAVGGYCTYVANCTHIRTYSVVVTCVHFQLGGVCAVLVVSGSM